MVDYGVTELQHEPGAGPPYWTGFGERLYAPSEFVSRKFVHSAEFMKISLNPGGRGGTCWAARSRCWRFNSYVTNVNCAGIGHSSRVDIPEILEWIEGCLD